MDSDSGSDTEIDCLDVSWELMSLPVTQNHVKPIETPYLEGKGSTVDCTMLPHYITIVIPLMM